MKITVVCIEKSLTSNFWLPSVIRKSGCFPHRAQNNLNHSKKIQYPYGISVCSTGPSLLRSQTLVQEHLALTRLYYRAPGDYAANATHENLSYRSQGYCICYANWYHQGFSSCHGLLSPGSCRHWSKMLVNRLHCPNVAHFLPISNLVVRITNKNVEGMPRGTMRRTNERGCVGQCRVSC